jgi:transposase
MSTLSNRTGAHISQAQKQRLVTAYESNGGNIAAAMRVAGIRSRKTAYLWWRRYSQGGDDRLYERSRARKRQNRVDSDLAEQVCRLRREHHSWGRRRIASELAKLVGVKCVSPATVEQILRRSGLWFIGQGVKAEIQRLPDTAHCSGRLDVDALYIGIRSGLTASLASDARRAAKLLYRDVWLPLRGMRDIPGELRGPRWMGLILRGVMQLGHSLMNAGDWPSSAYVLDTIRVWMLEHEELRSRVQSEDLGFRLRWDDLWIECYQYLSIVERDTDTRMAIGRINTAHDALMRKDAGSRLPTNPKGTLANVERDYATVLLRHPRQATHDVQERVHELLTSARELDQEVASLSIQAATEIKWAEFYSFQAAQARDTDPSMVAGHLDNIQTLTSHALDLVMREQSPILQAKIAIDAARLHAQNGIPLNPVGLAQAAEQCLTFGYAAQAVELLSVNDIEHALPSELLVNLRASFPVNRSQLPRHRRALRRQ